MLSSLSREALLERRDGLVDGRRLLVGLGRAAPHHHEAVAPVRRLEVGDVLHEGHCLVPLVVDLLDAHTFETRHPALVEHGLHRHDRLELARDRVEVFVVQHAGGAGGFERVRRDRVPATEHDVVEAGQRHELLDHRIAVLVLGAEADVGHLADRADRRVQALAGGDHAGDEGGGHGTHAGREDTELAGGGSDLSCGHSYR